MAAFAMSDRCCIWYLSSSVRARWASSVAPREARAHRGLCGDLLDDLTEFYNLFAEGGVDVRDRGGELGPISCCYLLPFTDGTILAGRDVAPYGGDYFLPHEANQSSTCGAPIVRRRSAPSGKLITQMLPSQPRHAGVL